MQKMTYKNSLFVLLCIAVLSLATGCPPGTPPGPKPIPVVDDNTDEGDQTPITQALFVRANPNPGVYIQATNVYLLASDQDAKIYYSADKNILPQKTDDFLYERGKAITIAEDSLIRFFAVRGSETTAISSVNYIIDFEAPTILFVNGTDKISGQDMVVRVEATDPLDIKEIRYTVNDAAKDLKEGELYNDTAGIVLTAKDNHEETYEIRIQAFDRVDKPSNILSETFVIDKKLPSATFVPDAGTFKAGPKVKITGVNASLLFYTTGTGTADDPTENSTSISSGDEIQIDSDNTLLKVLAIDDAGNKDIISKLYRIDASAPVDLRATTNIAEIQTLSDGNHVMGDNFKVTLSTGDSTDLIYFTISGAEPTESSTLFSAPIDFSIAKGQEKNFVLKFRAYDQAGNFTAIHEVKYLLDRKAPELTLNPPSGTFSTDVTVDIVSTEKGYALVTSNGSEPQEGATHTEKMQLSQSSPFKVSFKRITPGLNTIKAKVFDLAKHGSDLETRSYTIDNDAPDLVISPTAQKLFNGNITVKIFSKAKDLKDIAYCTAQGGGTCTPSTPISNEGTFVITFEGKTAVIAKASDQLGNSFETSITYEIDKTKPTLSFLPAKEVYGDIASQQITMTASEAATIYYTTAPYNQDGRDPSNLGTVTGQRSGDSPMGFDMHDSITIKAIAVDRAGNVTEPVQVKRIRFDRGERAVAIFPANYGPHNSNSSFKIECKQSGAINTKAMGHYAVDRTATESDKSFRGSGDLSANHFHSHWNKDFTLHVLCKDDLKEIRNSRKFHIDTVAPQFTLDRLPTISGDNSISASGEDYIGDTLVNITIKNQKPGDRLFVRINNFGESPYLNAIKITSDSTIFIRTQDSAQNEATYGPLLYKVFADRDGDRIADYLDSCPDNANSGTDSDMDGVDDACDLCDFTPDGTAHPLYMQHGTMMAGADSDGDGVGDACDTCRLEKNADQVSKRSYTNQNGRKVISKYNDGTCDETALIPFGFCGSTCQNGMCKDVTKAPAAFARDQDSDGIIDICDAKFIPEMGKWIKTDKDDDNDGVKDMFCTVGSQGCDNCQGVYNPLQIDSDGDDEKGHGGDACDSKPLDHDNDGFPDHIKLTNPNQTPQRCQYARAYTRAEQKVVASSKGFAQSNVDAGLMDHMVKPAEKINGFICDACYTQADTQDSDGDTIHNACDPLTDRDQDGISDAADFCDYCGPSDTSKCAINYKTNLKAMHDNLDADDDGVGDVCDNCEGLKNFDQLDKDNDGIGNECEVFEITTAKTRFSSYKPAQVSWAILPGFKASGQDRSVKFFKIYLSEKADFSELIGMKEPVLLDATQKSYDSPYRYYLANVARTHYIKIEALNSAKAVISTQQSSYPFVSETSQMRITKTAVDLFTYQGGKFTSNTLSPVAHEIHGGQTNGARIDLNKTWDNTPRGGIELNFLRAVKIDSVELKSVIERAMWNSKYENCRHATNRYFAFRKLFLDGHSHEEKTFNEGRELFDGEGNLNRSFSPISKYAEHFYGYHRTSPNTQFFAYSTLLRWLIPTGFTQKPTLKVQLHGENAGPNYDIHVQSMKPSSDFYCYSPTSLHTKAMCLANGGKWTANAFTGGGSCDPQRKDLPVMPSGGVYYAFGLFSQGGMNERLAFVGNPTFPIIQELTVKGRIYLYPGDPGYDKAQ